MGMTMKMSALFVLGLAIAALAQISPASRPRLREFGIVTGTLEPGPLNAITDVAGVAVGHVTVIEGPNVRTGVTAVLPHDGNIFQDKVPAAIFVANGFGKLTGSTQVEELGNLETPIILTNTLSVPTAADAVLDYILGLPENKNVESVNPVVGETNDGWLNDIRGRHVTKAHVLEAIRKAKPGPVEEGSVGAGTGTTCYGFKGGIGTSSRKLPARQGGYTVGVLVQTNHGGILQIAGIPVAQRLREEMGREGPEFGWRSDPAALARGLYIRASTAEVDPRAKPGAPAAVEGSCMIVVATDAPLDSRNLKRLAQRATLGIARTGGYNSNGSGDYAIAFSTAKEVRVPHRSQSATQSLTVLRNENVSPLFLAAAEAAEEAILNSLFKATRVEGADGHIGTPLPLEKLKDFVKK
jgi:D-aminopeptidase